MKQPTIGKLLDDAMVTIEADNAMLKGVLPKNYASAAVGTPRLGSQCWLTVFTSAGSRCDHEPPRLKRDVSQTWLPGDSSRLCWRRQPDTTHCVDVR